MGGSTEAAAFAAAGLGPARAAAPPVEPPRETPSPPGRRHNLPALPTRFVGRRRELAEVARLLSSTRLLTLTGPGGSGKTRLALEAAAGRLDKHPHGVWLVELAPLADPALVPQGVAAALGVRDQPGRPLSETLADALAARRLLLVLDNCEHLIEACAALTDALLRACPQLAILATSRQALGTAGELLWPVPPLSLPGGTHEAGPPAPEELAQSDAVELFVERARFSHPGFALTPDNAGAVVEICRRLDGLPLAIELAAARVRLLAAEQIAARLAARPGGRFRLLTGGGRTAPERQQNLRAAVAWSYDLLPEPARVLLGRLAVFAGGWTLEAAEAVCAGDGLDAADVLDLLGALVDQSLVVVEQRSPAARHRLLETIREFALERLEAAGEAEAVRRRHAACFAGLAEASEAGLTGQGGGPSRLWLERLETEHDNVRAALAWGLEHPAAGDLGLRLAGALGWFWAARGFLGEARTWLERAVERARTCAEPALRARVLTAAAYVIWAQRDIPVARALVEESVALCRSLFPGHVRGLACALLVLGYVEVMDREPKVARAPPEAEALWLALGDPWGLAHARNLLATMARDAGDLARACALFEDSVALFRAAGDDYLPGSVMANLSELLIQRGDDATAGAVLAAAVPILREAQNKPSTAQALWALGVLARRRGDVAAAQEHCDEALGLATEVGDGINRARCLEGLGHVAWLRGDLALARRRYEQGLALYRQLGRVGRERRPTRILVALGHVALRTADTARAEARFREALALYRRDVEGASSLAGLAGVALARGQPERAARLLGAAEALLATADTAIDPIDRAEYDRHLAAARAELGERRTLAAQAAGRAMPPDRAIEYALAPAQPSSALAADASGPGAPPAPRSGPLTRREREVAALVARGFTNRQIAAALVIAEGTADRHVANILAKLEASSRAQVAAWAVAHGLATPDPIEHPRRPG